LEAVAAGDARSFYEAVARDGDSRRICGLSPIYALLRCLEPSRGRLLKYAQWPDPQGTVTFASLAFHSEGGGAPLPIRRMREAERATSAVTRATLRGAGRGKARARARR